MKPRLHRILAFYWPSFLLFLLATPVLEAEPFVPTDGNQVLETLRSTAFDPVDHQIRQLRARLTADPGNLALACQVAQLCITRSRSEADPRYLGRAQAALSPWWDVPVPPIDALVLRATLKQSQHDFTNALADLELAAKLAPRNPQVWLTRATVLTVVGDYSRARGACLTLAELTPGLIALTAAAGVASLNGEAESGCALLRRALEGNAREAEDERQWALTVLAEAEERLGKDSDAEADYKSALAIGKRDPYLLGAYADFLLDRARAREAAELLKNENRADALLLRLALAEAVIDPRPADYDAHVAGLKARFEAGHLRGDFVHQREEARFTLHLLGQPEAALRLAQANWQIQHEPADLRILLECALVAGNAGAAQPALDFMRTNRLQDLQLASLEKQLSLKPGATR